MRHEVEEEKQQSAESTREEAASDFRKFQDFCSESFHWNKEEAEWYRTLGSGIWIAACVTALFGMHWVAAFLSLCAMRLQATAKYHAEKMNRTMSQLLEAASLKEA